MLLSVIHKMNNTVACYLHSYSQLIAISNHTFLWCN